MIKLPGQLEGEKLEDAVVRLLSDPERPQTPILSKDAIEALYSFGYGSYGSGNYEKAMHFFRFLTLLDVENRKHWMGLGASYQMLKENKRALECYAHAALLNPSDPFVPWHAAECFSAIEQPEQAREALSCAEEIAKEKPAKYKVLLERIKLIKRNKR